MTRMTTLAAALLAIALAAAPAHAGDKEVAMLQKYVGTWEGSAHMTGPNAGTLTCRLTMKANGPKLYYNARCALDSFGSQGFQGAIAYNDSAKRYEAKGGRSSVVTGQPSGGGIVFAFADKDERGSFKSTMALTGSTIKFSFSATDAKTGETTKASIPMKKS